MVAPDGLGGRPNGTEVGTVGLGCPVATAAAAIDAAKGFADGAVDPKGEGPNAGGPPPAADAKPVNGFGPANAEVLEPKAPLAGWMGCPNALVVGCVDDPNGLLAD
jgi:hypothetical protein